MWFLCVVVWSVAGRFKLWYCPYNTVKWQVCTTVHLHYTRLLHLGFHTCTCDWPTHIITWVPSKYGLIPQIRGSLLNCRQECSNEKVVDATCLLAILKLMNKFARKLWLGTQLTSTLLKLGLKGIACNLVPSAYENKPSISLIVAIT